MKPQVHGIAAHFRMRRVLSACEFLVSFHFSSDSTGRSLRADMRAALSLRQMFRVPAFMIAMLLGFTLRAASPAGSGPTAAPRTASTASLPGVTAAQSLSQVTGIAISPALGVAAVGAWKYFHTPVGLRPNLPWFAQPWFWGPALLIVIMVLVKDSLGTAVPKTLKKPFDVAELFENKLSGLVATGAIIPIAMALAEFLGNAGASAPSTTAGMPVLQAGFSLLDSPWAAGALAIPLLLIAYGAVFLVSHITHVLILISPFGAIDALLKGARVALIGAIAGLTLWHPIAGGIFSALIILACIPLAAWAFRWTVFGHVFAWDLVTLVGRCASPSGPVQAFLARRVSGVPARAYGRLTKSTEGQLQFEYRPWLLFPAKRVLLPEGTRAIGKGLIHPNLLALGSGNKSAVLANFPPRYGGQESLLATECGATEHRNVGLRAAGDWFRQLFRSEDQTEPQKA